MHIIQVHGKCNQEINIEQSVNGSRHFADEEKVEKRKGCEDTFNNDIINFRFILHLVHKVKHHNVKGYH